MSDSGQMILIVERENSSNSFAAAVLKASGYMVLQTNSRQEALQLIRSRCPELILLDLPETDRMKEEIRQQAQEQPAYQPEAPVLVLSALTSEFLIQIRTLLRRSARERKSLLRKLLFEAEGLRVDLRNKEVTRFGEQVSLTKTEYQILSVLCQSAGETVPYEKLLESCWGSGVKADNRILRVNIANIRRKLETNPERPKYILTETRVGYRMLDNSTKNEDENL